MLRAIGMSRRQVRRMIRYESVITALIGAVLGMVLGLIFAALSSLPLQDQGFVLSYPVGHARLSSWSSRRSPGWWRRSPRRAVPLASTCSRRWRTSSERL